MGSNLSKVNCRDSKEKKKWKQSGRVRFSKPVISTPSDFKHTFHVGSDSSLSKGLHKATKASSANLCEDDFKEALAQLTQALQSFPSNKSTQHHHKLKRKSVYNHPRSTLSDPFMNRSHQTMNDNKYQTDINIPSIRYNHDHLSLKKPSSSLQFMHHEESHESFTAINHDDTHMNDQRSTDFSSCLQSKIDAQIFRLARTRSINNKNRTTSACV